MKAHARVVAHRDATGATVLAELRGEAPLLPRATGARRGPVAHVHLVGGAAGPLGGDELFLSVVVGPGAGLVLRTVAASVALPGPAVGPSTMTLDVTVAAAGRLAWLPEPTVAAAGCDHRIRATVELDEQAHLVWREEVVAGRYGEQPGRVHQQTRLRRGATMVLAQDLTLGDDAWFSPAVVGAGRAVGALVVVEPGTEPGAASLPTGARLPLGGPVSLCTSVAGDAPALRACLDGLAPPTWLGQS
jgi:urease accessory protein